jgi:hypothetical protein
MEEAPQIGIWGVFLCPGRITRKRALAVSGEDFSGESRWFGDKSGKMGARLNPLITSISPQL